MDSSDDEPGHLVIQVPGNLLKVDNDHDVDDEDDDDDELMITMAPIALLHPIIFLFELLSKVFQIYLKNSCSQFCNVEWQDFLSLINLIPCFGNSLCLRGHTFLFVTLFLYFSYFEFICIDLGNYKLKLKQPTFTSSMLTPA